jgi:hypothetical protein
MSTGKYSPTVSAAYGTDQEWHDKLLVENEQYDEDGYDRYGYNWPEEKDRAGYTESEYLNTFETEGDNFNHSLYYYVQREWDFDGIRPRKVM